MYPEISPYRTEMLPVSEIHSLYLEVSGNADGLPVVYLHGGPGGGSSPNDRRYFDPSVYKIIVFDQRGSGKSTPHAWYLLVDRLVLTIILRGLLWMTWKKSEST